jgi:hypothetical protein
MGVIVGPDGGLLRLRFMGLAGSTDGKYKLMLVVHQPRWLARLRRATLWRHVLLQDLWHVL